MKTIKLTALSLVLLVSTSTALANNGDIGETVSATSNLSVTINPLATITGVVDLSTTFTGNNGNWTPLTNVCVATNIESAPTYRVQATGSGTDGAFTIADGSNLITYTVDWFNATAAGGTSTSLTADELHLTAQTGAHSTLAGCPSNGSGTSNASFRVTITEAQMRAAYSGVYTGTLAILIDPQ